MRKGIQAALAGIILVFGGAGCKEVPGESGIQRLSPVTNLRAYSADSTSVALAWTPSTSIQSTYGLDQLIEIESGSTFIDSVTISLIDTTSLIQNLAEGTIYTFHVYFRARMTSPYPSSFPATIRWSPATRFTVEGGSRQPLRVYESDSQGNFHALRFLSDSVQGPLRISLGSENQAEMDIWLSSDMRLRSGAIISTPPAGRSTAFSSLLPIDANSLDTPLSVVPDAASFDVSEFNIPTGTVPAGIIIFVRTQDDHYVRILLQKGSNHSVIQGNAPNRHIDIQVSYQSVPGVPYAMIPPLSLPGNVF